MSDFADIPSEELVDRAQRAVTGDTRAFAELVRRNRGKVVANCRYMTRQEDVAEDLAQEVFVKVFFKLKTFEKRSKFSTWVQRIKVNHCLNFLRKHKDRVFVDSDAPEVQIDPHLAVDAEHSADLQEAVRRRAIQEILDSMNDTLRLPLILCDMDGMSYQEAADKLGIGLSALKMRVKRGREFFRERYAAKMGDGPSTGEQAS